MRETEKYIKIPVKWLLTFGMLITMSVLIAWGVRAHGDGTGTKAVPATLVAPIAVDSTTVQIANMPETVHALGSMSSQQTVAISAQASGQVSAIYFKDGDTVSNNMPIVQLDNTVAKANYAQAVTEFKAARQKYRRSKLLVNTAISRQDLATLKVDMQAKEAAVKDAAVALDNLQITAPFSGSLGAFNVNVGDYVKAGQSLVTLVNSKTLQVNFNLPESLLPQLKQGQLVLLKVDAYPRQTFYGTVNYVATMVNDNTRTVAIEALVENKKNLLHPGMFVHVEQQIGTVKHALVVPAIAVLADVKGYYVYKIVDHKANKVYVQTGERLPNKIQILSGLKAGDIVVTAGQQKLEDGSLVKTA